MKIYWKYQKTNYYSIFERNTETEMERCIFDSDEGYYADDWDRWDNDTIEREQETLCSASVTEMTEDEVFLEMI